MPRHNFNLRSMMTFSRPCISGLFFGTLLFGSGGILHQANAGEGQMTLDEALIQALSLDPSIRKGYADVTEADGYMREVRSDLLPQLRLEGGSGYAKRDRSIDGIATGGDDLFSRHIGLVFEQLIFDGGFHKYRWKDAAERLKGKELLDVAQRETTAFGTVETYLDVIRARKQIVLARSNLAVHQKIVDLAGARVDAVGNEADVALSKARKNLASTLVRERDLGLRQAEQRFYRYVGQKPPRNLVSPKIPGIGSVSEIDATQNAHYRAALHQREGAELAKKAIEKRYNPRLLFRGTGTVGEDVLGIRGEDNEVSALVVVQWDLFEGGRKKGQMQQAIADIDRQQGVIDETLVLLNQDIQSRWEDYSSIDERIGLLKDYRGELKKTVDIYEEQFELGTRPLLSMLDVQNEEISASIRLIDEQFDKDITAFRLRFFGGRLIAETVGEDYQHTIKDEDEGERSPEVHPWAEATPVSQATAVAAESDEAAAPPRRGLRGLFGGKNKK